jgi:hypothetical protein
MDMKSDDTLQDAGNQNRRGFLKSAAASIAAGLAAGMVPPSRASGEVMSKETSPVAAARAVQDTMPTRNLGKTGFRVGIVGFGFRGELGRMRCDESLTVQIIQRALN